MNHMNQFISFYKMKFCNMICDTFQCFMIFSRDSFDNFKKKIDRLISDAFDEAEAEAEAEEEEEEEAKTENDIVDIVLQNNEEHDMNDFCVL